MEETAVIRTVYDYPVASHVCTDESVRYVKLVRRNGNQPSGQCGRCGVGFVYVKPKRSSVQHFDGDGATHF